MRCIWLVLLLSLLPLSLTADNSRVFDENKRFSIAGTWNTLLSFPYSIEAWLDKNIYSDYIATNATDKYLHHLATFFDEEPVFSKIHFKADNTGFLYFFRQPNTSVKMFFVDPGIGNGALRVIATTGTELWLDYIHIQRNMLLMRVFTSAYATNNGFYLVLGR